MGIMEKVTGFFRAEEDVPAERPGRNEFCWCGSGKKYKKCHLPEDERKMSSRYALNCGST